MADLVFIHGAGEDARVWDLQVAAFRPMHTVLAVDLPGRGSRTGERAHTSHDQNAVDVVRQMDRAGISRAVVIGHSMGGAVALTLALNHPAHTKALVLVVTGARLKMNPKFFEKARRRAEGGGSDEPAVPLEQVLAPSVSKQVLEWVRPRAMSALPATIYADFQANNGFDVMNRLTEIALPVLVIGAQEDRMALPKFSQFLAEKIRGARMVLFPACGHYPQVEQQGLFNDALTNFIREIS